MSRHGRRKKNWLTFLFTAARDEEQTGGVGKGTEPTQPEEVKSTGSGEVSSTKGQGVFYAASKPKEEAEQAEYVEDSQG